MAKIFLDTNVYIDAVYRDPEVNRQFLHHEVYVSPLSIHILCYALKLKASNPITTQTFDTFAIIDLTTFIMEKAIQGPTSDLEDNIQLHSASEAECDYFLTSDKKLLTMTYFGKTKITNALTSAAE